MRLATMDPETGEWVEVTEANVRLALSLVHVPTPDELDDLLLDITNTGYASEARDVVEAWTRKWWGVESALTTKYYPEDGGLVTPPSLRDVFGLDDTGNEWQEEP
jgi:hypothetical protein